MQQKAHKHIILLLMFATCIGVTFLALPHAQAKVRDTTIQRLRKVHDSYVLNLNSVDKLLRQQLSSTVNIKLTSSDPKNTAALDSLSTQLTELQNRYQEMKLRIYVVSRLLFQVESKFAGGDLRGFLEKQLLEMAYTEFTSSKDNETVANFFTYLSIAIRELPERHADVVSFIEGYIAFSTISTPKHPHLYLKESNYSNGSRVEPANPISREMVGEAWEAQVKLLVDKANQNKTSSDLNLGLTGSKLLPVPSATQKNEPTNLQALPQLSRESQTKKSELHLLDNDTKL